jgi:hypothetical protein
MGLPLPAPRASHPNPNPINQVSKTQAGKQYRRNRLKGWPPPPLLRPAPLRWFRARFLYALDPADGNLWKYLHQADSP